MSRRLALVLPTRVISRFWMARKQLWPGDPGGGRRSHPAAGVPPSASSKRPALPPALAPEKAPLIIAEQL